MNAAETHNLLILIKACSPAFTAQPGAADVWAELLGDIPEGDAKAAVKVHFLTGGPWIGPADIRRRVLAARGLLPPDPEAAYGQARRMNSWLDRRVGPEPEIHPAAMKAAREVGWSTFDGPEGVSHRRFVDAYRPAAEREAERALTTRLDRLVVEVAAPKALPAGSGVQPDPDMTVNRTGQAKVRQLLDGFGRMPADLQLRRVQ